MILRRTIAAFLVFALAGLVSAPAFAGAFSCAMDDKEACCCAAEERSTLATAEAPDCDCPGCACVLDAADALTPFYPINAEFQHELAAVASPATAFTTPDLPNAETVLAVSEARGPPGSSPAPLYLLYDTLLI